MSIYIVTRFEKSSLYSPQGEVSPGKGFLWGINQNKMGLGRFWGIVTFRILRRTVQDLRASIYTHVISAAMSIIISIAMLIT